MLVHPMVCLSNGAAQLARKRFKTEDSDILPTSKVNSMTPMPHTSIGSA